MLRVLRVMLPGHERDWKQHHRQPQPSWKNSCNEASSHFTPPRFWGRQKTPRTRTGCSITRAFLLLLYAAQVGQAFLPAPQRTGLEACPYLCRTRYTNWRNALAKRLAALHHSNQHRGNGEDQQNMQAAAKRGRCRAPARSKERTGRGVYRSLTAISARQASPLAQPPEIACLYPNRGGDSPAAH